MRGRANMLRTRRKLWFGMLFSIAACVMVSVAIVPIWAADLEQLSDDKILEALKAKRLTRCPRTVTRSSCGGAQIRNPSSKGRLSMSKSHSTTARSQSARHRRRSSTAAGR
jgi:hypothetical protein